MSQVLKFIQEHLAELGASVLAGVVVIYCGRVWVSYRFFAKRGIKTPPIKFFFGNFSQIQKNQQTSDNIRKLTQQLGKTYGYYQGHTPVLVTSDIEIIQEVFIKQYTNFSGKRKRAHDQPDNSELHHMISSCMSQWKRLRVLSSPAFTAAKLKQMSKRILRCTNKLVDKLNELQGREVSVMRYLKNFTMDTIWNCSFSCDMDFQNDAEAGRIVDLCDYAFVSFRDFTPFMYFATYFPEVRDLAAIVYLIVNVLVYKLMPNSSLVNPMFRIGETTGKIVEFRMKNPAQEKDYLQVLIDSLTNKKLIDPKKDIEYLNGDEEFKVEKQISPKEMRMGISLFILAGYETTSTTMGLLIRNLALMPHEQEKVLVELQEVFYDPMSVNFDYDNIQKLEYMDMFIRETLRMTPIATSAINRRCMKPTSIKGIDIPKNLMVVADVLSIHYDPELWGPVDPEEFYPARFSAEHKRHPCAFLGFGIGPRYCIGDKFAMLEMKTALAKILLEFSITREPNDKIAASWQPGSYKYKEGIVRSMIDPVNVVFTRRIHN